MIGIAFISGVVVGLAAGLLLWVKAERRRAATTQYALATVRDATERIAEITGKIERLMDEMVE